MAVERIEQYRQKNDEDILKVWIKPSKAFPKGGYFYADFWAIELVQRYSWHLSKDKVNTYIRTCIGDNKNYNNHVLFANEVLGFFPACIDHRDGVDIDNIDRNLNVVSQQQNIRNRTSKGYAFYKMYNYFMVKVVLNYQEIHAGVCKSEIEALIKVNELRKKYYLDYDYDFLLDRRGELDILDLERTGQISADEATYRHVIRYASNAWYYYRYGLQDYFRQNGIPIPEYSLDTEGFMVDKVTGKRLCPL